jgi:hypothetical protein
MGVEYRHFLIPRPNSFLPEPEQVISLLTGLVEDRWIVDPDSESFPNMEFGWMSSYSFAEKTGAYAQHTRRYWSSFPFPFSANWFGKHHAQDLILCWPVENLAVSGLRYPLNSNQFDPSETYYELQLHFSPEYVYRMSEVIEPFTAPIACAQCGEALEFWPQEDDAGGIFYSARLHSCCPRCATPFDVARLSAVVRDGRTGEPNSVPGGACYRFAIVVDCGKCIPGPNVKVAPRLRNLCQDKLGYSFYEIGDFY